MTQAAPICLVTRPEPDASRFAALVRDRFQIETCLSPLMRVKPLSVSIEVDSFSAVILTSPAAARLLGQRQIPASRLCYCVGDKTAAVAEEAGYPVQSAGGDAGDLVELLQRKTPTARFAHLRGAHSTGNVARRLRSAGIMCDEYIVYEQESTELTQPAMDLIRGQTPLILPVFSPRSAALLSASCAPRPGMFTLALSAAVAARLWPHLSVSTSVAVHPTEAAMVEAMYRLPPLIGRVEKGPMQS